MHTISIDRHHFIRQPEPYPSECHHEWGDEAKLPPSLRDSLPYDASLCQSFCMDAFVQADCGCTVLSVIELDRGLSQPCDILNPVTIDCVLNAFDNVTHMTKTLEKT